MTIKERIGKFISDQFGRHGLSIVLSDTLPKPIKTHGLANFWFDHGRPRRKGDLIRVKMMSGATAMYELVDEERARGVDWSWYTFHFVRYVADEPVQNP